MNRRYLLSLLFLGLTFGNGCGGGGGSSSSSSRTGGSSAANFDCDGACPAQILTTEDVTRVLQQAITASSRLGVRGTFAVVDRVGNVLALYQMGGAPTTTTINGQIGAVGGLESLTVPATVAAISKAGTGAYLSSQGNAFSSRTANHIVQENFSPGEEFKPGGPLFGVQFSQLLCSDVTVINPSLSGGVNTSGKVASNDLVGPRPLPLGLSADPGGLPLYKNGDLVGGIGVEFDGAYSLDRNIFDIDDAPEERVALTASLGFEAPSDRIADQMFVGGRSLRYSDIGYDELDALPDALDPLEEDGLKAELFYSNGDIRAGAAFGDPSSGVANIVRAGVPAAVLVGPGGGVRFPTRSGSALSGGDELTVPEVDAILDSAILTANRARAAIRTPRDTAVRVSIWVVDTLGDPLGFVRSQDAPVFGIDVSLQKARSALFFSSADAGQILSQASGSVGSDYNSAFATFTNGQPLNGSFAFSARGLGNLSRPFFIDGINSNLNGPFSLPFPGRLPGRSWSPFNTGLQLDFAVAAIAQPLGIPVSPPASIPTSCTDRSIFGNRLRNGVQIFAGGVPLYRNGVLIGAIGISGDGIDQDDMVAFFSSSRRGLDFAGHTNIGDPDLGFNAPRAIRCDKLPLPQSESSLRYVSCPEGPFSGSNDQNVCEGL